MPVRKIYGPHRFVPQVLRYHAGTGGWLAWPTPSSRIEADDELGLSREYPYYDPIYILPEPGRAWWRTQGSPSGTAEVISIANATG